MEVPEEQQNQLSIQAISMEISSREQLQILGATNQREECHRYMHSPSLSLGLWNACYKC
uniref:Uncharacterized protein n=1 Tax=Brassica oleracea TaxID=3712 RepID=A0A3P6CBC5_BRAOL|nr:unnamed protein product [Brassica oleracea]